uniref:PHD-type domain-containing protein n=1 Tax=Meloidogyne hapla TaxID=6305 RepID=A0A1I8B5H6_MELHA
MSFIYESKLRNVSIVYDKDSGLSLDIEKTFQSPQQKRSTNSSGRSSPDGNYCCSCLELVGGKLYTCTRCKSSFHFICHFPPLLVNNKRVDTSNWICNRCQIEISQKFEQNTYLNTQDPQQREDFYNKIFIRFLLKNRFNSKNKKLSDIAKAMHALNSREFSLEGLGIDNCFYKLPFDELFNSKNEQNLNKKSCFYCRRSEEKHIISCDFCHANFCFDCLSPPLTACVNERFMCPLHVERFVDSFLVNSLRVTDRIALWKEHNKLEKPESLAVFYDFFTKIQNEKEEKLNEDGQNICLRKTGKIQKIPKRNGKNSKFGKRTFEVNKKVKEAYKRSNNTQNLMENELIDKEAANILMAMRQGEQIKSPMESELISPCNMFDDTDVLIFHPDLFNIRLPVFAALQLIDGADKLIEEEKNKNYLIPIQSKFVTIGSGLLLKNNCIDLSRFSSCRQVLRQRVLIFFDKCKLAFEMVALTPYYELFKNSNKNICGCLNQKIQLNEGSFDEISSLNNSKYLIPSTKNSSTLWSGALIKIGCLKFIFAGLGAL